MPNDTMVAMNYEILVRRAYDCDRHDTKGADADIFRALLYNEKWAEENPNDKKKQNQYTKSLSEVKKFTIDALEKGIKVLDNRRNEKENIDKLLECVRQVNEATVSSDLFEPIRIGLDVFVDNKIPNWQ